MKIFLLTQNELDGWDTYDSIIVCAETKGEAILINPIGGVFEPHNNPYDVWAYSTDGIDCEELGEANENQKK